MSLSKKKDGAIKKKDGGLQKRRMGHWRLTLVPSFFVVIEPEKCWVDKGIDGATLLFGGSSSASRSVHKTADTAHLEQFVLLRVGYILVDFRNQLGTYALLDGFQHAKRVSDGGLLHTHHFARLDVSAGFHVDSIDGDAPVFDGVYGDGTRLEDARRPQPFVDSGNCLTLFLQGRRRLMASRIVLVHTIVILKMGLPP